jgi:hypothetical protein
LLIERDKQGKSLNSNEEDFDRRSGVWRLGSCS